MHLIIIIIIIIWDFVVLGSQVHFGVFDVEAKQITAYLF